jgi:hypothetical protein
LCFEKVVWARAVQVARRVQHILKPTASHRYLRPYVVKLNHSFSFAANIHSNLIIRDLRVGRHLIYFDLLLCMNPERPRPVYKGWPGLCMPVSARELWTAIQKTQDGGIK